MLLSTVNLDDVLLREIKSNHDFMEFDLEIVM